MGELVHVKAVWGCLIYIMNTPTDDMNNRIKGSWQGWNPTASRQFMLPRKMC